jgi:protein-disulfide isomerase
MADRMFTAIVGVLCVGAASTTVVLASRPYRDAAPRSPPAPWSTSTIVPNWRRYADHAYRVSPDTGAITVIEFSDFQCPFCRRASFELDTILARYPGRITVLFHNFPLGDVHADARVTAIAAECANRQGAFRPFMRQVFAHQDELGTRPMAWFAAHGGIAHLADFKRCQSDSSPARVIDDDVALGSTLGIEGTPTILIDSAQFSGAPPLATMDAVVRHLLRHP